MSLSLCVCWPFAFRMHVYPILLLFSCSWLVAWRPGMEEPVTTTSCDPIGNTLPLTLKEDEESSEKEGGGQGLS